MTTRCELSPIDKSDGRVGTHSTLCVDSRLSMVETVIPNFCTIDLRTSSDTIGGIIAVLSYWKKVPREGGRHWRGGCTAGEREGERKREMETERGKGEYEARVSGRVNNNARRQMSIPPPLFAWSAQRSLISVPLALLRTSLCRRQRPMSSSNTRLGGPQSTWCGPTPIKHHCFVESPSTGISSFFSFTLSFRPRSLILSLSLHRESLSGPFVLPLDRSLTFYRLLLSLHVRVPPILLPSACPLYAPGGAVPSRKRYENRDEWRLSCDVSDIRITWSYGSVNTKIL